MIEKIVQYLSDKKILILGFGAEGQSTYRFLRAQMPELHLTIADKNINLSHKNNKNTDYLLGEQPPEYHDNFDVIIKSPGVPFKEKTTGELTSQLDLFLRFTEAKTIGITGTKGKSTTSSLLNKMLAKQGVNTLLAGNIGIPFFDCLNKITADTVPVLELSSYQLERVTKSPHIALFLNIYEEHSDFHGAFDNYVDSKLNIARFQSQGDFFIYNAESADIIAEKLPERDGAKRIVTHIDDTLKSSLEGRKLHGDHNLANIAAALEVCRLFGPVDMRVLNAARQFGGLPHRMEYVGNYGGINYYDDVIATIPQATISCINALREQHGRVDTLIVGGKDRGVDLSELIAFLRDGDIVKNVVCIPTTGAHIAKMLDGGDINVHYAADMAQAVAMAKKITPKNGICVLSPAASSYDFYKDFNEKGDDFRRLLRFKTLELI
ncbi:MAG: UDP-N-acetylmuramoyl-L-alanine--D-glutamate ligase [Clostridiales bacterium]|jgi:UDP-N-acetylmuramoylalanine--D-glutamate ligase|nr:UDP-N-acetylmuramoyl-L-alanine--D-glutamate ligase [Clostridiales bacterium]